MNKKYKPSILFVFILTMQWLIGCTSDDAQKIQLSGVVRNYENQQPIYPAYVLLDNELVATSDSSGYYQTKPILPGAYALVFSALNFTDKIAQVEVSADDNNQFEVLLQPDDRVGKVYGEFHDKELFAEALVLAPEKADWNNEQLYDGVSGATIQPWNWSFAINKCQIKIGDSIISRADDYGQFAFNLQCGTYPLTATCEGYNDTSLIVNVKPENKTYINFFVSLKATEK